MNKIKFNEIKDMEAIANGDRLQDFSDTEIVKMLARYNCFVRNLDYDANRKNIKTFVDVVMPNVDINEFARVINAAAKSAKKYPIVDVEEVVITNNELDIISSVEDLKQEKILFVILALAKYNYALYNGKYDYTAYCKYSELFKMAKVSVPSKDRPYFMQPIVQDGLISISNTSGTVAIKPLFVDDSGENVALRLGEVEFKSLANTYCAWKHPSKWRKCRLCKTLFKKYKNDDGANAQVCKDCKEKRDEPLIVIDDYTKIAYGQKMKKCISCEENGRETWFIIDSKDGKSTMCPDCYAEHRKQNVSDAVKRCRSKSM